MVTREDNEIFYFLFVSKRMVRCQGVTLKGVECKREAESGSAFCWQHKNSAGKPSPVKSPPKPKVVKVTAPKPVKSPPKPKAAPKIKVVNVKDNSMRIKALEAMEFRTLEQELELRKLVNEQAGPVAKPSKAGTPENLALIKKIDTTVGNILDDELILIEQIMKKFKTKITRVEEVEEYLMDTIEEELHRRVSETQFAIVNIHDVFRKYQDLILETTHRAIE